MEDSNLIVKVKFLSLFEESIPVTNKSGNTLGVPTTPFIKKGCVFRVDGVIKNTARIEVPSTIQVPDENWRRSFDLHKEKHAGATSKSYNVPTYTSAVSSPKKAAVLFLQYFQGMFDLAAKHSFDDDSAFEKIEMLLQAK